MSETAAQEGQYRWSRVKFTHGTEVQYHHGTNITPQQNTIGRNPSPGSARGQSTYLHLQANILDAVTFLWSRWFSKTLQHSSTPGDYSSIRQERNVSPFSTPFPPLPPPLLSSFVLAPLSSCFDHKGSVEGEESPVQSWLSCRLHGAKSGQGFFCDGKRKHSPFLPHSIFFFYLKDEKLIRNRRKMYFIMQIAVEGEKCVLLLMFKGDERNKNKKKKLTNAFLLKIWQFKPCSFYGMFFFNVHYHYQFMRFRHES